MPSATFKAIEAIHQNTIGWLWNEIYDKIYRIGETNIIEELTIQFPLDRIYEIDGYWKKYKYDVLDFGIYKLKLNTKTAFNYKGINMILDFYADGRIGYLEIHRTL